MSSLDALDVEFPPKLAEVLFKPKRYLFIRGGRGCIHPDSLIETPSGNVRIADFTGGEIYAFDGNLVVVAYAGRPVFYPAAQLYRVVFADGSEIKTTAKHRFLSAQGWVMCSSLLVGDLIAAPLSGSQDDQLLRHCAVSPSELLLSVHHYLRILAGFQWSYFEDCHQGDGQLLRGAKTVLDVARQLSDEQQHSSRVWMREDGPVAESRSNPSQLSHHLASLGDLLATVALSFAEPGSYSGDTVSELISASCLAVELSHGKNSPQTQAIGLSKLFLVLDSLQRRDKSLETVFGILRLDVDDSSYSSQFSCNPDRIITKRVVSVDSCEVSPYCDLFVPFFNNYISAGVVHHNSGKSWSVARALILKAFAKPERILCTREVQKSIKQSVHQLLKDQITDLGLDGFFTVLENEIRGLNGSAFFFSGLSDLTSTTIKSFEGCTLVWCEEAQALTQRSWRILTPTIRADNSEIWATYNPELETDETHMMAVVSPPPDTISVEVNYPDNPWFPAVLEAERKHAEATMRPDDYNHIWGGRCKPAVEGAIYFESMAATVAAKRIREVPHDGGLKTHIVFDLGMSDAMTLILVQKVASEIRIIHAIEGTQRILADYSAELKGLRLDDQPMNWGTLYLPHDGFHVKHQTGKDDATILRGLGWDVQQVPNIPVNTGIDRAREVFPRVYFNQQRTERLVECLKRYRWNINSKTGQAVAPLHDEFSHFADAFRYLALTEAQMTNDEWGAKIEYKNLGYR